MLNKETFITALSLIQEQDKINEEFSDALQKVGNGYFVFGGDNKYFSALLMVLKAAMHDDYDYISWWLYDTSDYTVSSDDGNTQRIWDLREPGALYDYLVEEYNERKSKESD